MSISFLATCNILANSELVIWMSVSAVSKSTNRLRCSTAGILCSSKQYWCLQNLLWLNNISNVLTFVTSSGLRCVLVHLWSISSSDRSTRYLNTVVVISLLELLRISSLSHMTHLTVKHKLSKIFYEVFLSHIHSQFK